MNTLVTHDMPTVHVDDSVCDNLGHIFPPLLPSLTKHPPRRPKNGRIESQFMSKKTICCSRWNQASHNHASYNNPLP